MSPQLFLAISKVRDFIRMHHAVIFIVIVGLLLAYAIFTLYEVLTISFTSASESSSTISSFDQKTIDKIKRLHNSADSGSGTLVFPSPRPGPFAE